MVEGRGLKIDIDVDGGITISNAREVLDAGANVLVAGSSVFTGNPSQNVESFLKIFEEYNYDK